MVMPKNLIELIKEAQEILKNHPNRELILPIRKKILKTFGEYNSKTGKKRRTQLDILCIKYAMPSWESIKPKATKTPLEMLDIIEDFFQNKISATDLDIIKNQYWTEMETIGTTYKYQYQLITQIGFAAINTVCFAIADRDFLYQDNSPDALDEDGDPHSWDTSFYISGSLAGFFWNKGHSPNFREHYWNWYLDEAVPEAYNG